MLYATCTFTHIDRDFKKGQEVDESDPMVALRPDLFTDEPPKHTTPKGA